MLSGWCLYTLKMQEVLPTGLEVVDVLEVVVLEDGAVLDVEVLVVVLVPSRGAGAAA